MTKTKKSRSHDVVSRQSAPLTVSRDALLIQGSDKQFRELVHSALAFSSRLDAVRNEFGRYIGLTGIQYSILISVAHLLEQREVGISEVAEDLSLSGTFVTTEVGKLVGRGLLVKTPNAQDKRRVVLALTKTAWALITKLAEIQSEINDVHFAPLSRQDFLNLHRMMRELTQSTERALVLLSHINKVKTRSRVDGSR